MTTLREQFIQGIIAKLSAEPAFPATVERSLTIAFTRSESPVVVVHRGAEVVPPNLVAYADRTFELLVSVISRGDTPDALADEVLEVAHPLVMAYSAPHMIDIQESKTTAPMFSNTSGAACMTTVHYHVIYRTDPSSLTV